MKLDPALAELLAPKETDLDRSLTARAMALPGYVGLCRISGGAHGYSFVGEIVQVGDNQFLCANANDVGGALTDLGKHVRAKLDVDLRVEIARLKSEIEKNGGTDFFDSAGGRHGTLKIRVGEEALRVAFTRPLAGTEFRDTAVDRLYRAVWGWPGGDQNFPRR